MEHPHHRPPDESSLEQRVLQCSEVGNGVGGNGRSLHRQWHARGNVTERSTHLVPRLVDDTIRALAYGLLNLQVKGRRWYWWREPLPLGGWSLQVPQPLTRRWRAAARRDCDKVATKVVYRVRGTRSHCETHLLILGQHAGARRDHSHGEGLCARKCARGRREAAANGKIE